MADTKFELILEMLFLKIRNVNASFDEKILTWKSYIINKNLPTIKQIQIIDLKEFTIVVLDVNSKIFVMHVTIQKQKKWL